MTLVAPSKSVMAELVSYLHSRRKAKTRWRWYCLVQLTGEVRTRTELLRSRAASLCADDPMGRGRTQRAFGTHSGRTSNRRLDRVAVRRTRPVTAPSHPRRQGRCGSQLDARPGCAPDACPWLNRGRLTACGCPGYG